MPSEAPPPGRRLTNAEFSKLAEEILADAEKQALARRERRAAAAAAAAIPIDYSPSLVTFIDILGFRHLVKNRSANDLAKITRIVHEASSAMDLEDNEEVELRVLAFSDSVVRVRRISFQSAFFHELLALVHMQASLAARGVLVRGALTVGNVFADRSNAFGPAFVRAYELESTNAFYPRIIIDDDVLTKFSNNELGQNHNEMEWEAGYIQGLLDLADDGFWFVDYLRAFDTEVDKPEYYVSFLKDHKRCIETAAAHAGSSSGTKAKIHWLAAYHNRVVAELDEQQVASHGGVRADLLAPEPAPFKFSHPTRPEIREHRYWRRSHGPKASR